VGWVFNPSLVFNVIGALGTHPCSSSLHNKTAAPHGQKQRLGVHENLLSKAAGQKRMQLSRPLQSTSLQREAAALIVVISKPPLRVHYFSERIATHPPKQRFFYHWRYLFR